jgi:hypothetical protein
MVGAAGGGGAVQDAGRGSLPTAEQEGGFPF